MLFILYGSILLRINFINYNSTIFNSLDKIQYFLKFRYNLYYNFIMLSHFNLLPFLSLLQRKDKSFFLLELLLKSYPPVIEKWTKIITEIYIYLEVIFYSCKLTFGDVKILQYFEAIWLIFSFFLKMSNRQAKGYFQSL